MSDTITEQERYLSAGAAKARTLAEHRGTGYFPVVIGATVVGHVQKNGLAGWRGFDLNGVQVRSLGSTAPDQVFSIRGSAVALVGRTDAAVHAFRESRRG